MSLRETDLIQTTQLRRRPTSYAKTLITVSLRTYGPAPRAQMSNRTEHYAVVTALAESPEANVNERSRYRDRRSTAS
jgi:hypothetical protein